MIPKIVPSEETMCVLLHFGGKLISASSLIFSLAISLSVLGQESGDDLKKYREHDLSGFLIVIFSPEVDVSGRTASQGVVWKSFVQGLRESKVRSLEVVNEVAINDAADRARAFELALGEKFKHTIWLQFSVRNDQPHKTDNEKFLAKYIVFAPSSNTILGQGEVEQERPLKPGEPAAGNRKLSQDIHRRGTDTRSVMRVPEAVTSNAAQMMDVDALSKIGGEIAGRVISAATNRTRSKKTP